MLCLLVHVFFLCPKRVFKFKHLACLGWCEFLVEIFLVFFIVDACVPKMSEEGYMIRSRRAHHLYRGINVDESVLNSRWNVDNDKLILLHNIVMFGRVSAKLCWYFI